MPIVTSGWPNLAVSTASRIVQAIASSQPPPKAKPLTAAMTGLPRFSMSCGEALPVSRLVLGLGRGVVGHFADVRAGGERLVAGAGQDHAAHRGIVTGILEDLAQLRDGGLVEGVEHLRPVERHIRDRSLFLVQTRSRGLMLLLRNSWVCPFCEIREVAISTDPGHDARPHIRRAKRHWRCRAYHLLRAGSRPSSPRRRRLTLPTCIVSLLSPARQGKTSLDGPSRYTNALKPVMALPTIRFCIWYVPS